VLVWTEWPSSSQNPSGAYVVSHFHPSVNSSFPASHKMIVTATQSISCPGSCCLCKRASTRLFHLLISRLLVSTPQLANLLITFLSPYRHPTMSQTHHDWKYPNDGSKAETMNQSPYAATSDVLLTSDPRAFLHLRFSTLLHIPYQDLIHPAARHKNYVRLSQKRIRSILAVRVTKPACAANNIETQLDRGLS
jgi:hypothetical protein